MAKKGKVEARMHALQIREVVALPTAVMPCWRARVRHLTGRCGGGGVV